MIHASLVYAANDIGASGLNCALLEGQHFGLSFACLTKRQNGWDLAGERSNGWPTC